MTPISGFKFSPVPGCLFGQCQRQGGFTLLELLLVLTIVGIASVFVVPNLTGLEARTFSVQLRQANSLLNYARRIAVVSGQASTVRFNVTPVEDLPPDDRESAQQNFNNTVAQWHGSGVQLLFQDSTNREIQIEENTAVTFYPQGGSSGGVLFFSLAEQRGAISIDPFNGRITSLDLEN